MTLFVKWWDGTAVTLCLMLLYVIFWGWLHDFIISRCWEFCRNSEASLLVSLGYWWENLWCLLIWNFFGFLDPPWKGIIEDCSWIDGKSEDAYSKWDDELSGVVFSGHSEIFYWSVWNDCSLRWLIFSDYLSFLAILPSFIGVKASLMSFSFIWSIPYFSSIFQLQSFLLYYYMDMAN